MSTIHSIGGIQWERTETEAEILWRQLIEEVTERSIYYYSKNFKLWWFIINVRADAIPMDKAPFVETVYQKDNSKS